MNKPTNKASTESKKPKSYEEAHAELEGILDELQGGDVDVGKLTEKVSRSSELIKYCRAQITAVEMQVKDIINSAEPDDASESDDDIDLDL